MTPRWALVMMGGIATLLAVVPFVAFYKGPWIRAHSPYSKQLMAEEAARIEKEVDDARAAGLLPLEQEKSDKA